MLGPQTLEMASEEGLMMALARRWGRLWPGLRATLGFSWKRGHTTPYTHSTPASSSVKVTVDTCGNEH